jgi:S1-C subfamily serine protease
MKTIEAYQVSLPLLKGILKSPQQAIVSAFLGSATVLQGRVFTCRHVVEAVDFSKELVLTKWDLNGDWVVFDRVAMHTKYDFAELKTQAKPPFESAPLYNKQVTPGTLLYAVGYHHEGSDTQGVTPNIAIAPRLFHGNVVRVWEIGNNKSPAVCELSFPTLSGFSGGALIGAGFDRVFGMVYGNLEQSIQVHSKYELKDGAVRFSETVNRILELGLFHSCKDLPSLMAEVNAA